MGVDSDPRRSLDPEAASPAPDGALRRAEDHRLRLRGLQREISTIGLRRQMHDRGQFSSIFSSQHRHSIFFTLVWSAGDRHQFRRVHNARAALRRDQPSFPAAAAGQVLAVPAPTLISIDCCSQAPHSTVVTTQSTLDLFYVLYVVVVSITRVIIIVAHYCVSIKLRVWVVFFPCTDDGTAGLRTRAHEVGKDSHQSCCWTWPQFDFNVVLKLDPKISLQIKELG